MPAEKLCKCRICCSDGPEGQMIPTSTFVSHQRTEKMKRIAQEREREQEERSQSQWSPPHIIVANAFGAERSPVCRRRRRGLVGGS